MNNIVAANGAFNAFGSISCTYANCKAHLGMPHGNYAIRINYNSSLSKTKRVTMMTANKQTNKQTNKQINE